MKNVMIKDALPNGLEFVSASWKVWNGASWDEKGTISPNASNMYNIGDINNKAELIVISKVPDEDYALNSKTYYNTATITSNEISGQSSTKGIGVGYGGFTKEGVSNIKNGTVEWTLKLDPKEQPLTDIVIYDLFVYGDSLDNVDQDTIPAGVDINNITKNKNQKFVEGSFGLVGNMVDQSVYTIKNTNGNNIADLLVIKVSDNSSYEFKFKTKIMDPKIYAGNNPVDYKIPNSADMHFKVEGKNHTVKAESGALYTGNTITKESLHRNWTTPVNKDTSANKTNSFDYIDKSAVYRILVNKNDMNLTDSVTGGGQGLSGIKVRDTLPLGWEFKKIEEKDFLLYEADSAGNHKGTPIDPTGIVEITVTPGDNNTQEFAVFNFAELKGAYIILLKAGPTEETAKEFFKDNKVPTDFTNSAEFFLGDYKLSQSNHKIRLSSTLIEKGLDKTNANSDGYLIWTVDYNPYAIGLDTSVTDELAIIDNLPIGLDLRTDNEGRLLIGSDGEKYIRAYKMILGKDGKLAEGEEITLIQDGEDANIFYDINNRILKFIINDHDVAHRLVYFTDITASTGTLENKAMLTLKGVKHEGDKGSYQVSDQASSATLKRGGSLVITKQSGDGEVLEGVDFTLYAKNSDTIIREGVTDIYGKLVLKALPIGEYRLVETYESPVYYKNHKTYIVKVEKEGGKVITSIDGQIGDTANLITIKNYKKGTVGDLVVSKTLSGNAASMDKDFEFTLHMVSEANKTYNYVGGGKISDGAFTFDEMGKYVFSLKGGDSIRVQYLPEGAAYIVTEKDYSSEGYKMSKDGEEGIISADGVHTASFVNSKNSFSGGISKTGRLVISKTVNGAGGDREKRFTFTVTFEEKGVSYPYTGVGSKGGKLQSGDKFTLAHGESITITDLPDKGRYSVKEDDYTNDGYTTTVDNAAGTIVGEKTAKVHFVNEREGDEDKENPTNPTEPEEPEKPGKPEIPIGEVENPNKPGSPDEFVLADEDGTPLGHYKKQKQPDGTFIYVDENGIPLKGLSPKTGDTAPFIIWGLLLLSLAGMMITMIAGRRLRRDN